MNGIQAHSWYNSCLYAYRWDFDRYTVHIYRLSGSNRAYHGADDGLKTEFSICGTQVRTEYWPKYRSKNIGQFLLLFICRIIGSDRYIMYRREAINRFSQRVGLDNCCCNYLAICRYYTFPNKKPFQSWIKYI